MRKRKKRKLLNDLFIFVSFLTSCSTGIDTNSKFNEKIVKRMLTTKFNVVDEMVILPDYEDLINSYNVLDEDTVSSWCIIKYDTNCKRIQYKHTLKLEDGNLLYGPLFEIKEFDTDCK
jgi:hypothetical protein